MSALIGDFEIGTQPLWPAAAVSVADWFDLPSWERPTEDNPDGAPVGTETFSGTPGFGGTGGTAPSTGTPGFDGDPFPGSTWNAGGGAPGGTITVVTSGGVVLVPIYAHRTRFWRVEVYDEDGVRVAYVPHIISGKLQRRLDQASTLEFKVAMDSEGASDLVRPNYIVLRDRWGFVVETFQILRRRPIGSGDASYLEIVAQGKIAQLGDEVVIEYSQGVATTTVGEHVAALLDLQAKAAVITLGTIDPEIADIELPFYAADTSIHAALLQLQAVLPKDQRGRFYLDAKGKFQWRLVPGDTTEQVITRGRNVQGITAETDYSLLVNRIYLYGEGQDKADRLRLTDAGEAEDYLEDAASVTTWGLSPAIKVDRRIRYPETLLRMAERILEEFATPQVKVEVDLLDLAKADDIEGWHDIEIGGKYRVVDTALGVDSSIEIVGIEVDFARPVAVRVELANQTKTLGDLITGLVEALEQPLDVDGDRYKTMGRNYSERDARDPRMGDTRWKSDEDRLEAHDGTDWQPVGGGTPSTVAGEPIVAESPAVGTSEEYARADHEHLGMPWITGANKAALPTTHPDGVIGYTTDSGAEAAWHQIDGAWTQAFIHLGTVTTLPAIPAGYAATCRFALNLWCAAPGDTYWTPMRTQTTYSGAPGTVYP